MDTALEGQHNNQHEHSSEQQPKNQQHQHTDHSNHEIMFRNRFWVTLILTVPVLLFSATIQDWLDFSMPDFTGDQLITPILSIIIFAYGGVPFLQMAVPEIRNRQPGMMTLISLAITVAFVYSLAAAVIGGAQGFFWEMATLIVVMLLGHWFEMRSIRQASGALDDLAKLMPDTAEKVVNGDTEEVPVSELSDGDMVLVRPGASIPVDGKVIDGRSKVNEAMITGESKPIEKTEGAEVIGGTINGDGSLRVKVTATGENTALAGIMRLVKEAQNSKSKTQLLADQAAGWLFYVAIAVAALTTVGWVLAIGFEVEVLQRVVTVLVIACPHALGLAIPLVVAISTSLAAANGILIRDRLALEAAHQIDVIVFDKTGTLTRGEHGVVKIITAEDWTEQDALGLAAAIEADSEHMVARGIRQAASDQEIEAIPQISDFEAIRGRGVKAQHDGQDVYVGGPRLLEQLEIDLSTTFQDFTDAAGKQGQAVVYLIENTQIVAAFALADVIRPESYTVVKELHARGTEVAMLTGDSEAVAKSVANELGIDQYFAEVLPEHKDEKIIALQQKGKKVAMVGDGINDAPALTRADIGIAIGSGTDVAIESAGIILVNSNPLDVLNVVQLSRANNRKMIQNLIWASAYNVVALPLAAGILAPVGFILPPAVGALFMSLSTIIVAINAQFLRLWEPVQT